MRTLLLAAVALAMISCSRHSNPAQPQPAQLAQAQAPAQAQPQAGAPAAEPMPSGPVDGYGAALQPNSAPAPAAAPVQSEAAPPMQTPAPRPSPFRHRREAQQPEEQQPEQPVAVVIPAGTHLRVRMEQTIDTRRNRSGDRFEASLISPVVVGGNVILPRGTLFDGHVTEARPSGRLKGRAILGVELDSFRLNGVSYPVVTAADTRVSGRHRKRNLILIGGGSGLGAALGAIAGGPAGALIGAGAGAGAGTAGAFFTGKKNVSLPVETALNFTLRRSVEMR